MKLSHLLATVLLSQLLAPLPQGWALHYQTVIVSGRPDGDSFGPELGTGIDWDDAPVESFVLNSVGQLLFSTELDDAQPEDSDRAVWRWTNGIKELLIREGSTVGGEPGVVSNLDEGINLANNGTALVSARIGSLDETPIVAYTPDGAELVVTRNNRPVPDPSFASRASSDGSGSEGTGQFVPSLFPDGSFLDSYEIAGPAINTENNGVLWYGTVDDFSVIAREGDLAPGYPAGSVYSASDGAGGFGSHRASGEFQIFRSDVAVPGVGEDEAFFLRESGVVSLLANNATPTNIADPIFRIFDADVNSAGDIALWAHMRSLNGPRAIFRTDAQGAPLQALAFDGIAAPDTGETFGEDRGGLVLTESGAIAFNYTLTGPTVNTTNDRGIWIDDDAGTRLAVREGDAVSNLSGVSIGSLTDYAINDRQLLVGLASLTGTVNSGMNDQVLWSVGPSRNLEVVLRSGDLFDVNPGGPPDLRMIEAFSMGGFQLTFLSNRPHEAALNGNDQLALGITFADGTDGLFLIDLSPVPEPASAILVSIVAAFITLWRCRIVCR